MTYLSPRKRNWAPHYSFLLYYVHSYDDAMLRVGEGDQNSEWPASVLTTNATIPDHGLSAITLYLVPPSTNNVTSCNRVRLHVFGHRTGGGNLTNFEAAATAAPNWAANAAKCPTCAPIRNKWVTILLVYCLYWPACSALPCPFAFLSTHFREQAPEIATLAVIVRCYCESRIYSECIRLTYSECAWTLNV